MWLIPSFINAIVSGLQNAYFKKSTLQIHPILMLWSVLVVSSILFSPLFLFGIPHINNTFWTVVILRLLFDTVATAVYIKALQISPLSLTIPMLSFEPVFLIFTQILINHLFPSPLGVTGVLITVGGIYFLNFDHDTKHILSPFKSIAKQRGVQLIIVCSILWSFVAPFKKVGIDNSSLYFYTAFVQLLWAVCLTPIAFLVDKKGFKNLFTLKQTVQLFPAGAFDAVQIFAQYIAYTLASPLYVSVVGNTSILFSSFFGWLFLKEKIKQHVIPTIIIVIGIILITFTQK